MLAVAAQGDQVPAHEVFGYWSLVPPLLAIVLAIATREALLSLFLGVWSGGIIHVYGRGDPAGTAAEALSWLPFGEALAGPGGFLVAAAFGLQRCFQWIFEAAATPSHFKILLFTAFLGSAVAFAWNLGGARAVRNWALERLNSKRGVGLAAYALGLLLFFDDYANTAIVGSSTKDVAEKFRMSREKLAYIVDSTAAPVSTLTISSWVAFQLSQIEAGYEQAGVQNPPGAFEVFLQSIPYNMYAILALAMVAIVVVSRRDYGKMLAAERRSWSTGEVTRDDAQPMQDVAGQLGDHDAETPRMTTFVLPIVVLVAVTLLVALWTGGFSFAAFGGAILGGGDATGLLYDAVIDASYADALVFGSFAMVASGFVLALYHDIMDLGEGVETTIDGFGIMLTALVILILAWSIGVVVGELGTGDYVARILKGPIDLPGLPAFTVGPAILPALIFLLSAFIAFSTGTAWGTMSIVTPIGVNVAWQLTGSHTVVAAIVGAVFSGAIFGDHCSPISDTTVLSSTFTGSDLVDHVRTQLYYALTVAAVTAVLFLTWGYLRISPLLLLPVGVLALIGLVYGLSELHASVYDVSPVAADADREQSPQEPDRAPSADD
ncbi:sodium:proton antiporter [Halobacteriales archaeon QS_9_70_65]|nr:MAG: sodium:proton antiporter [Halobacteriales archaeon QS_9_70_65]